MQLDFTLFIYYWVIIRRYSLKLGSQALADSRAWRAPFIAVCRNRGSPNLVHRNVFRWICLPIDIGSNSLMYAVQSGNHDVSANVTPSPTRVAWERERERECVCVCVCVRVRPVTRAEIACPNSSNPPMNF